MNISRTDRHDLLDNGHLPLSQEIALKHWLKRYYGNNWMHDQDNWLQDACLVASCQLPNGVDLLRVLYCSRKGMRCERPRYCRRCNLDQRLEPLLEDYGSAFDKVGYWSAMVAGTEVDPNKAGLRFGPMDNPRCWFPYQGAPTGHYVSTWPEQINLIRRLSRMPFELCRHLVKYGFGGALCVMEPHLKIFPGPGGGVQWCKISHALLLHGHILFNSPVPLSFEEAQTIFRLYNDICGKLVDRPAYPDLWIDAVVSQDDINSWIGYSLKSWALNTWYQNALRNGCPRDDLNELFDWIVFENLDFVAGDLRALEKYGNLRCSKVNPHYIGKARPMQLTQKQIKQWLKDPDFQAQHRDWEDAAERSSSKWAKRQGLGNYDPLSE